MRNRVCGGLIPENFLVRFGADRFLKDSQLLIGRGQAINHELLAVFSPVCRVPKTVRVPHSFAFFANEWVLDCVKALDRTALDFQRPLLKVYSHRSRLPRRENGSLITFMTSDGSPTSGSVIRR